MQIIFLKKKQIWIASTSSKRLRFMSVFSLRNRNKSAGGRANKYGGWSITVTDYLAKNCLANIDKWVVIHTKPIISSLTSAERTLHTLFLSRTLCKLVWMLSWLICNYSDNILIDNSRLRDRATRTSFTFSSLLEVGALSSWIINSVKISSHKISY